MHYYEFTTANFVEFIILISFRRFIGRIKSKTQLIVLSLDIHTSILYLLYVYFITFR